MAAGRMSVLSIGRSRGRRRKESEEVVEDPSPPSLPAIKPSPSLPELASSLGLAIPDEPLPDDPARAGGATGKARITSSDSYYRPGFHKPTSFQAGSPPTNGGADMFGQSPPSRSGHFSDTLSDDSHGGGDYGSQSQISHAHSIASLYSRQSFAASSSHHQGGQVPNVPGMPKSSSMPNIVRRPQRAAPTLNILVVGAARTGKTSFLKTLLGTTEVAPGPTAAETRSKIEAFGGKSRSLAEGVFDGKAEKAMSNGVGVGFRGGNLAKTKKLTTCSVEIIEKGERVMLTVIDTPGLDIKSGDELEVGRQMNNVMRYVEDKFTATLKQENEVFRHAARATDQHVHLCLYFIHPESINSETSTPAPSSTTFSLSSSTNKAGVHKHTKSNSSGTIARSLSTPSLAGGDKGISKGPVPPLPGAEDTDDIPEPKMSPLDIQMIKRLHKRVNVLPVIARADELTNYRLEEVKEAVRRDLMKESLGFGVFGGGLGGGGANDVTEDVEGEEEDEDEDDEDDEEEDEDEGEERQGEPSKKANGHPSPIKVIPVRALSRTPGASARRNNNRNSIQSSGSENDLDTPRIEALLPFALIAPEEWFAPAKGEKGGKGEPKMGIFVRQFRWGKVDVLNEEHCDFSPLRQLVLGAYMKILKDSTRQEFYEKFRTEKLLARRATQQITDAQRQTLLTDLAKI